MVCSNAALHRTQIPGKQKFKRWKCINGLWQLHFGSSSFFAGCVTLMQWIQEQCDSNQTSLQSDHSTFSTILALRRRLLHHYYRSLNFCSRLHSFHIVILIFRSSLPLTAQKITKQQSNHIFPIRSLLSLPFCLQPHPLAATFRSDSFTAWSALCCNELSPFCCSASAKHSVT